VLERNVDNFVRMAMPSNAQAGIIFTQPFPEQYAGGILFNNVLVPHGFEFIVQGNTVRMVIDGAGRVGLGQDFFTPANPLHINTDNPITAGVTGGSLRIGTTAGASLLLDTNDLQAVASGVASKLSLNALGGNVGVGTASPTAKLEIGGTAGTDGIKFPDGSIQTTAYQRLKVSAVFDPPSVAAGASVGIGVLVSGAAVGDVAIFNPRVGLPSGLVIATTRVNTNSVAVTLYNASSLTIDAPSNTADVVVLK
jgi:hypothetical protein